MKKIVSILFSLQLLLGFTFAQTFTLSSSEVGGQATQKQVFKGFGCEGGNISPQLSWANAPAGTKSFAITIHDKNAPTGSGWWHWLAFDIPANVSEVVSGAGNPSKKLMPAGVIQSITDFGAMGYGGPCPPEGHGIHEYLVTVHALKVEKLGLDKNANPALVGYSLNGATIQKASIIFYHER